MDSRLDSLFRQNFRPAEKTDAWLGIQRHDPDQPQRKKPRDKDKDEAQIEDNTFISLSALHSFLKTLLFQSGNPGDSGQDAAGTSAPRSADGTTQTAQAALAYRNTARHGTSGAAPLNQDAPPHAVSSGTDLHLSDSDKETIRQLIADIETLATYGVQNIALYKAETFLESLVGGVRLALAKFS